MTGVLEIHRGKGSGIRSPHEPQTVAAANKIRVADTAARGSSAAVAVLFKLGAGFTLDDENHMICPPGWPT